MRRRTPPPLHSSVRQRSGAFILGGLFLQISIQLSNAGICSGLSNAGCQVRVGLTTPRTSGGVSSNKQEDKTSEIFVNSLAFSKDTEGASRKYVSLSDFGN
ncbi:hypothetical protein BRADI_1g56436v3 [Brachypodium distachyon]|uniref:Uncharacterized protein n=1 Tax=Brachypodium distachyon TaxID=15368 RepID=A0A2K2DRS0_BRADI|nr:hypothetical protein BRADI_1g56436v3 [Brachypodium distachyon]